MKQFVKKKISFVMAMFMVMAAVISMALPMSASAQGGYTLTLSNEGETSHNFEIYQIFSGDLSENGKILTNIQWGTGILESSKTTLGDADAKARTLDDVSKAKAFAKEIQQHLDVNNKREITVASKGSGTVEGLNAGYYLVKDKTGTQTGANSAYTAYILKVVGNTTAETKLDVPTLIKKVKENSNQEWQDAADYNIGDKIPYKLTGTLPGNYDEYETYFYKFHDTVTAGLTIDRSSVTVKVVKKVGSGEVEEPIGSGYVVGGSGNKLEVSFDDLKDIESPVITSESKIVVEYECTLNEQAVIGKAGNPNTAYLEYSNNPNESGGGDHGTTPEDKNIVFTYKVVVNKKDEGSQPLAGAEFELYKKTESGEVKIDRFTINSILENAYTFGFKGLDAGTYVLKESKAPSGYNKIDDIEFTIKAGYDTEEDDPKLKSLTVETTGTITFTPNLDEGSLSTDVINKKGIELPETGGMGRYLIYTLGTIFVLAALGYAGYKRTRKHSER